MKKKPIAIVLGGTSPHIVLVKELKKRGYYVVLIDYLPNPPAKEYADEHILASTLDKECVLNIAKELNASLVISSCIDQANSVCCYVAERMGLPHPYSFETSQLVTDKGLMKQRMLEYGIPTSSFTLTSNIEDIDWAKISFPCVVKPVDCNSSKGVHKADTKTEVKKYVEEALCLSRTHKAIIEGYCTGNEIQVDCLALEDEASIVMTRQKKMIRREKSAVLQSFGSVVPAPLSNEVSIKTTEIANKIANAFHLRNTPFFYQAIVSNKDINVLEFAPRIGGGLSYYMLKNFVGFHAVESVIDSFLGNSLVLKRKPLEKCYRTCLLYAHPCVFDHIEGLQQLKDEGFLKEFFITKCKGDAIDEDLRSSNRVGSFIVSGKDAKELEKKIIICLNRIKIIDTEGKDMMNRLILDN